MLGLYNLEVEPVDNCVEGLLHLDLHAARLVRVGQLG